MHSMFEEKISHITRGQSVSSLNMAQLQPDRELANRIGEVAPQFFGKNGAQMQYLSQAYLDTSSGSTAGNIIGDRFDAGVLSASFNSPGPIGNGALMFGFAVNALRQRLREGTKG